MIPSKELEEAVIKIIEQWVQDKHYINQCKRSNIKIDETKLKVLKIVKSSY